MKIALLANSKKKYNDVYAAALPRLSALGELSPIVGRAELAENAEFLRGCEAAFSTWSMPALTADEIREYLPNLKALFYAAGTVQAFARPFLECGVRIFSAAEANGVPVAEYTAAQITLALKGYFQSAKLYRPLWPLSYARGRQNIGGYQATVGLVGLGAIGRAVAEKLRNTDVTVLAYDPFVSEEQAAELGVKLVDIKTLMGTCDVVSNHLANKPELKNFFDKKLFRLMKNNAVFINTGRGAQVDEFALAAALIRQPKRTAVIDVLKREFAPVFSPLWWCPNAVLTPHIAGSTGREVERMAALMLTEYDTYLSGGDCPHEVTAERLQFMA